MMKNILFAIECDPKISNDLKKDLQFATNEEIIMANKNNLDGSLETILQIVQIVSSIASLITPVLSHYINKKKIKKIVFGGIEIENPTKEQWELIWKDYLSQKESLDG